MSQMERIRQFAEELLTFQELPEPPDRWLWDRACRIARSVQLICKFPEILEKGEAADPFCLTAAAYLSDVGFKLYAGVKGLSLQASTLELRGRELRDFSVRIIHEKCAGSPITSNLDRICRILAESENRLTRMPEAMILSDARSLNDVGNLGVLQEIRRCLLQGKGPEGLLEGWDRKIEYRYWEARLKEGFHLRSVQQIAQQRFSAMEQCILQLRSEHLGSDLENISLESIDSVL